MSADDVLAGLDPEQREVALATRGPVCVLAGAGTGKTRAITHRIAYAVAAGVMDPAHVLAVTFTVRAAGELRGRLRQLGPGTATVRAATFHSAALRQLNFFWPKVIGGRPPQLVDGKAALIREAAKLAGVKLDAAGLSEVATEIEWAKSRQVRPAGYEQAVRETITKGIADVYAAYERLRRERNLIDFESVLELTAAILLENRNAAEQVQRTFRFFVVDEYQDVNPLQKLLLDAWLGGRDDLCVVGDPQQTIYSFTGASADYLRDFGREFPAAKTVSLVRDYRSTPQVVAVANQLIRTGLVAQRPAGPQAMLTRFADERDEADGVVTQIRAMLAGGVRAREVAILVRINAQTERFELALAAAGVPFLLRGAERFYERAVVKQALVLLRGAARGQALGTETGPGSTQDSLPGAVRHVLTGMGFAPAMPAAGGQAARERWESLAAIAQLADDMHATQPGATLPDFSAELNQRADLGHAPVADGVTLASIHAAKGLEWDAVLLPGLVEGMLPISHARTQAAVEEERRLLYVAVTRAREHLYLSWSPARAPGTRPDRVRSRFLDDVRLGGRRG